MYRRDIPTWGALKLPELLLLFIFDQSLLKCLEYNRITGSKQCELTALCGDNQEPVNMGFRLLCFSLMRSATLTILLTDIKLQ